MTTTRAQATRPAAGVHTPVTPLRAPAIVHDVLRSHGRPLEPHVREEMEGRFGYDFARVRVHADATAAQSARTVGALAYAVGRDIVFAPTQYAPGTHSGRRLLAHELAHVVQQGETGPPAGSGLELLPSGDPGEREAERAAKANTAVGGLTPSRAVVARQPQPPAPCALNCTDPAFLALSVADRTTQLSTQCPQGFPSAAANVFFGRTIPGATSRFLHGKLHEAETRAKGAMCLAGRDPAAFTLSGQIITYAAHSPAEDKAVDINVSGQPYVMHESNEPDIDREIGPVYNRMAFWGHYRGSIIPRGITSVTKPAGTHDARRTWRNPVTATQEATTTGQLYDLLQQESTGMGDYFGLLRKSDAGLTQEIDIFLMFNTDPPATLTSHALPLDSSAASVTAFRQRIADDYRLLGGTAAGLAALAGAPTRSATPAAHHGDRPFAGRSPESGFLTMPREVLVALTEVGLSWGAVDFGAESGDVMHIDCRGLAGC
jgi:hypothetical protein